jgi:hypothetical protein
VIFNRLMGRSQRDSGFLRRRGGGGTHTPMVLALLAALLALRAQKS